MIINENQNTQLKYVLQKYFYVANMLWEKKKKSTLKLLSLHTNTIVTNLNYCNEVKHVNKELDELKTNTLVSQLYKGPHSRW